MPLYEVTKTYYVWAENRLDAEYITPTDLSACDTDVEEIHSYNEVATKWRDAIPFGYRNDDKTCKELAEQI